MQDIEQSLDLENRRIAERFQLNLPIVCDGRPATSINISLTGIRFVSPQPLNVGSKAYLKVYFGKERVNLVGDTVWSENVGRNSVVGAAFVAGSDLDRLSRQLRKLSK